MDQGLISRYALRASGVNTTDAWQKVAIKHYLQALEVEYGAGRVELALASAEVGEFGQNRGLDKSPTNQERSDLVCWRSPSTTTSEKINDDRS